jgi:hypothetical protein
MGGLIKKMNFSTTVKILFVVLSVSLAITGFSFKAYQRWYINGVKIRSSHEFMINGIYQTGSKKEGISTNALAEMLDLSIDRPVHLLDFDEKKMEQKLMSYPIFKSVKISKRKPSSIYIDYDLRDPIAVSSDYLDAVIDDDGVIFPYRDFFTQKKLPHVYFGIAEEGDLQAKKEMFFTLLKTAKNKLEPLQFRVVLIDVSKLFAESFSKRELILKVEQEESSLPFTYYLRMNGHDHDMLLSNFIVLYHKELKNKQKLWLKLHPEQAPPAKIIDLRLDGMALIE